MGSEWVRVSDHTSSEIGRNLDNFQKQMIAESRGVRPRARLTGRAGGLERLDPGPIWAASK